MLALRPSGGSRVAWVATAVAWLLANAALEGPVLWELTDAHGVTVGDLLVPASLLTTVGVRYAVTARG